MASLPITPDDARDALISFVMSCPSLTNPNNRDISGLTLPQDWTYACEQGARWPHHDAVNFFRTYFETLVVGDGRAHATGYYEPQISGVRQRQSGFDVPIFGRPNDLISVGLQEFDTGLPGTTLFGKLQGNMLRPYDDRTMIEQGSLQGRAPIIAWGSDPVDVFFLQIQGSGQLIAPDGTVMRIGYDGKNGHPYTGVGRLMQQRGLLQPGETTAQGIKSWLRRHPVQGRAIMQENKSFVFFREISDAGPLGAMGYPVRAGSSVAVDPHFIPMGAPVFLTMEHSIANGLWIAQDRGSAINGANRVDTFWGAGKQALDIAGGMSSKGQLLVLVPWGLFQNRFANNGRGQ